MNVPQTDYVVRSGYRFRCIAWNVLRLCFFIDWFQSQKLVSLAPNQKTHATLGGKLRISSMQRICQASTLTSELRRHHNKRRFPLATSHGSWFLIPLWIQMYSVPPSSFKTGAAIVRKCFVYKLWYYGYWCLFMKSLSMFPLSGRPGDLWASFQKQSTWCLLLGKTVLQVLAKGHGS